MPNLNHLRQENLRNLIGTRCHSHVIFAIDGTNTENTQTGAAAEYSINGIMYTLATDAEIDISAEKRLVKTRPANTTAATISANLFALPVP